MGVLTLAATQGSEIHVEAKGKQAEEALRAVEKLVEKKFLENE
jgi:phosphotransferase system HPr (HPr) family protein